MPTDIPQSVRPDNGCLAEGGVGAEGIASWEMSSPTRVEAGPVVPRRNQ